MVSKLIMSMLMICNDRILRMPRPDLTLRRVQTQLLVDLARVRHASERLVEGLLRDEGLTDITPAQANALLVLVNARSPLTAARLAEALSISEVTVGRFVRAMEAGGWVARERDPDDSRAWLLVPTARTRERLPSFIRVSNALLDRAFAGVAREDVLALAAFLGEVRQRIEPPKHADTGPGRGDE
jgi:DNA-binding MarR family transcriptional regulator